MKGIKVYFVLSGTGGKIDSARLKSTNISKSTAALCDPSTGLKNGWNPLSSLFLTPAQAKAAYRKTRDAKAAKLRKAVSRFRDALDKLDTSV